MRRWLTLAAAALALAGCATPVTGRPVAAPTSAAAKPDGEIVRWVNNFCGVANYMVASGGFTLGDPGTDPAQAKQSVSDSLGRVVDVLNVVLHDLDALTPAPDPAADTAVELMLDPLTRARDKFVSAKATVDGAAELTPDVFESVMQAMTEAVTVLSEAAGKISVVSLPEEFKKAVPDAENCKG